MGSLTLSDLSDTMRKIDIAVLSTHAENGEIAGRPMSNNGEVEFKGDSFFFTTDDTHTVRDIERDPKVSIAMQGAKSLLGKPGVTICVEGRAEIIRQKSEFQRRWTKDLDIWFEKGVDTPGLVLIKVHANRIHYWDGTDEGELRV